jgi:hypothetical protein
MAVNVLAVDRDTRTGFRRRCRCTGLETIWRGSWWGRRAARPASSGGGLRRHWLQALPCGVFRDNFANTHPDHRPIVDWCEALPRRTGGAIHRDSARCAGDGAARAPHRRSGRHQAQSRCDHANGAELRACRAPGGVTRGRGRATDAPSRAGRPRTAARAGPAVGGSGQPRRSRIAHHTHRRWRLRARPTTRRPGSIPRPT